MGHWIKATLRYRTTPRGHELSIVLSPDESLFASCSKDWAVRVWDLPSGKLTCNLEGHQDSAQHAAFSPNGRLVVSASDDSAVRVWKVDSQRAAEDRKVAVLRHRRDYCLTVAFSPDGKFLASASDDEEIIVWSIETWSKFGKPMDAGNAVVRVTISADSDWILSATRDGHWKMWELATRECLCTIESRHKGGLGSLILIRAAW
ncbi:WD40-repeat-containing domain protein [Durotheca rogersii]|uniref:WD40-repeat-containing domain protein n=1 Tax=Durotheca rogersii TaxID=419775 RepID=UPI0022210027|nr:WD40-repeat-containing domain protein [Durotheca rogersii]KAI5862088.1 WD40-repeat-containing domain protein [Durotheca rogersii]